MKGIRENNLNLTSRVIKYTCGLLLPGLLQSTIAKVKSQVRLDSLCYFCENVCEEAQKAFRF
jgi:hypothetical protein